MAEGFLNNLKGYSAGTLAPNFAAFRDKVAEFVADVQEELGVLDELRYFFSPLTSNLLKSYQLISTHRSPSTVNRDSLQTS